MYPTEHNGAVMYSWFQTTFNVPSDWKKDDLVINFGAVDYEATVFVNVCSCRSSLLCLTTLTLWLGQKSYLPPRRVHPI